MRAVALVAVAVAVAMSAGCGGSAASPPTRPTALVLTLRFNQSNVDSVRLNGATSATSRRFGPYTVAASQLLRDGSIGLVFDPSDAGSAMVCAEAHDPSGRVMASGCDTFDIVAAQVSNGSLTLVDPNETHR